MQTDRNMCKANRERAQTTHSKPEQCGSFRSSGGAVVVERVAKVTQIKTMGKDHNGPCSSMWLQTASGAWCSLSALFVCPGLVAQWCL